MRTSTDPVALVFGRGITPLAVLRELGRGGVEAWVPGETDDLVRRSRYYRRGPGTLDEPASAQQLAGYLATLPTDRTVLFPCSDRWAGALASLPESVTAMHRPVVPPLSALTVLVDKASFGEMTASHGIPAPRTFRVRVPADLDALSDEQLRGSFLKPVDSQAFSARFGVKAFPIDSRKRALERLAEVTAAGQQAVIQEFIPGPASAHVFLDGFVDRSGAMRGCLARRRVRMFPPPFGNSTLSETIPLEASGSAPESLRRLFAAIGFRGLFDAEFKQDDRDGEFKVIEVNARPWWQLPIAAAAGLDVVMAAYRDAAGLPSDEIGPYRTGQRWLHPLMDLRAWWALGRPAPFPLRAWKGAANAVYAPDDPRPLLAELTGAVRAVATRARARRDSNP